MRTKVLLSVSVVAAALSGNTALAQGIIADFFSNKSEDEKVTDCYRQNTSSGRGFNEIMLFCVKKHGHKIDAEDIKLHEKTIYAGGAIQYWFKNNTKDYKALLFEFDVYKGGKYLGRVFGSDNLSPGGYSFIGSPGFPGVTDLDGLDANVIAIWGVKLPQLR